MKYLFTICLFVSGLIGFAQTDSVSLKVAMERLDKGLMNKDDKTLDQVLNKEVSYGHSNGWVQNKQDILNDLKTGKLVYTKIENNSVIIVAINKDWAMVRTNTNAEGSVSGTAFQLKLFVLQVWIHVKEGWQLLARQSTKL